MSGMCIWQRIAEQGETLKVSRSHAALGVGVHFMEAVPSIELQAPGMCSDVLEM